MHCSKRNSIKNHFVFSNCFHNQAEFPNSLTNLRVAIWVYLVHVVSYKKQLVHICRPKKRRLIEILSAKNQFCQFFHFSRKTWQILKFFLKSQHFQKSFENFKKRRLDKMENLRNKFYIKFVKKIRNGSSQDFIMFLTRGNCV